MDAEASNPAHAAVAATGVPLPSAAEDDAAGNGGAPKLKRLKQHPLASSIKRMMQADDDVGKISKVSPALIGRALELFLGRLCSSVGDLTMQYHSRIITPAHLKACVNSDPMFDFLKDVEGIAAAADLPPPEEAPPPKPKRQRSRKAAAAEGENGEASPVVSPKKRAPRTKAAKKKREEEGSSQDDGALDHASDPDSDGTGGAKPPRKTRAPHGGSGGGRGRGRGRTAGRGRATVAKAESDVELSDVEEHAAGQPQQQAAAASRVDAGSDAMGNAAGKSEAAAEAAGEAALPLAAVAAAGFDAGHAAEEDDYDEE